MQRHINFSRKVHPMKTEKGCRVKMSHELQSCIDEPKQYEKICVSFVDVANMVTLDVESFKLILN